MEEWRDIAGYKGRYQVSNLGRVKTVERHKSDGRRQLEAIRKTQIDHRGYEFALLYDGRKYNRHSVHVLVANAFVENPDCKPQVNHIDGDKLNNMASNLEWCTPSENVRHALRTGLFVPKRGDERKQTRIPDADVRKIRELRNAGETLQAIADKFGISFGYVGRISRNERRVQA